MKLHLFAGAVFALACPVFAAPACDAGNGGITLPAQFCAQVVADNLGNLRHITVLPNGDAYVTLASNVPGAKGGIIGLRDANGDGKFEIQESFGTGKLTGIGVRNGYLYAAGFNTVTRWKLTPGTLKPTGAAEVVVDGLPGVNQHGDKGLAFDGQGSLYVNVGAPSNTCQKPDRIPKAKGQDPCPILEKNGGVWKFSDSKLGQKQEDGVKFATGLRQFPAITWHDGALYIGMNSRDQMDTMWPGQFTAQENAERPAEPLFRAVQGSDFGWPYCYFDYPAKKFLTNPEYGGDGKQADRCGKFTPPVAAFPAHWAPLALAFHDGKGFPAKYRDGVFIAFHGSWNRAPLPQAGYNVTFQPIKDGKAAGEFEVFAQGFPAKVSFTNPTDAMYRPDGVAEGPDGSLFITDSEKGRIWRVMVKK
jgi:glucose/arabinose dehydrogenase